MQHFSWVPPHCPNRKCRFHKPVTSGWSFKKAGFYTRLSAPWVVQRFTCKHCNRNFSRQTFSTTYWQKRPDLDTLIFMKTVGGMANRQIARDLCVSPQTIDARLARLGRHCLLFHQRAMREAAPVRNLVIDGFESFELSQYYPFHHHVAVEKGTDFFVYFSDSELRRKGRMRPDQKKRRLALESSFGRPAPRTVERDMAEVVTTSLRGAPAVTIYSDDHRSYPRALGRLGRPTSHHVTSSKAHRDRHNPLWEVNLLDLLIRHSGANHKRETIAWSKRRQASAERLAIFLVWRNYIKRRREKDRSSATPAMARGMARRRYSVGDIMGDRIFRDHVELPPRWDTYYKRAVTTRALPRNREHRLTYAY